MKKLKRRIQWFMKNPLQSHGASGIRNHTVHAVLSAIRHKWTSLYSYPFSIVWSVSL